MTAVLLAISAFLTSCSKNIEISPASVPASTLPAGKTPLPVETIPAPQESQEPSETAAPVPVELMERTFRINGRDSRIYMMTADIADQRISVVPYLSFGKIYGFETLNDMVDSTKAFAGVNGGFFFEYGRPSGLVVIDGETVSPGSGKYESIVIYDGNITFEKIETLITVAVGDDRFETVNLNLPLNEGDYGIYSRHYGNTDRLGFERKYIEISAGEVSDYGFASSPEGIPPDGYIICLPMEFEFPGNLKDIEVSVNIFPSFSTGTSAYEGASMLVKDGISLAGDTMPWVGNLNKNDPRTCIGKLKDGRLGFVVIDGRQEGYSTGTTGRETADILIELGFTDAFMLDGGASSAMYFDGNIVNSPADMGIERILAGSVLLYIN